MKSKTKLFGKVLSLSIVISCIAFGLYAQNLQSNLITQKNESSNEQLVLKKNKKNQLNKNLFDHREIAEEKQKIEAWMLDSNFWKLNKKIEWEEEPREEPRPIEEWMLNFTIQKTGCIDLNSNIIEKDWMKKQSFFIL